MMNYKKTLELHLLEIIDIYKKALSIIYISKMKESNKAEFADIFGKFQTYCKNNYPNIVSEYVKEKQKNSKKFENIEEMLKNAIELYHNNKILEAKEKFEGLLKETNLDYFKEKLEILLYECEHKLKGDFDEIKIKAYQTFEKLDEIYQNGLKFENEKEFVKAIEIYENLLKTSKFIEFDNKAMAGLYRCEKALNLY